MTDTKDTTTNIDETNATDEVATPMPESGDTDLQKRIAQLEKQLAESQEITKRAQSDYLRLKRDMDALIERTNLANAQLKDETFIIVAQKVLPGVLQLQQTLQHIPEEQQASGLAEGVRLSYQKIIAELASLGIEEYVPQLGTELDLMFSIPLGTQPVEDEMLKNNVCAVVQTGFIYTKTETPKVILPARVFVGA